MRSRRVEEWWDSEGRVYRPLSTCNLQFSPSNDRKLFSGRFDPMRSRVLRVKGFDPTTIHYIYMTIRRKVDYLPSPIARIA